MLSLSVRAELEKFIPPLSIELATTVTGMLWLVLMPTASQTAGSIEAFPGKVTEATKENVFWWREKEKKKKGWREERIRGSVLPAQNGVQVQPLDSTYQVERPQKVLTAPHEYFQMALAFLEHWGFSVAIYRKWDLSVVSVYFCDLVISVYFFPKQKKFTYLFSGKTWGKNVSLILNSVTVLKCW